MFHLNHRNVFLCGSGGDVEMADDSKIKEMLQFFDNETENGMLYISYPMVEAIRHYKDMNSFRWTCSTST